MFPGYLQFGCTEIINASRAYHQARDAGCGPYWFKNIYTDTLADALNEGIQYDAMTIQQSPWFEENKPETGRFYGVFPLAVEGVEDSTQTAVVTEGLQDGGDISGFRNAARQIRVRAMLLAKGDDALTAGMNWLKAALQPSQCASHGDSCGQMDLRFFDYAPPSIAGSVYSEEPYDDLVYRATREIHGVTCVSGPLIQERRRRTYQGSEYNSYTVQFIFACETSFVFSLPRVVSDAPTGSLVIQDIPYNLAKYPSAELPGASVVVAQNLSSNPSVETNATGWSFDAYELFGPDPSGLVTAGRTTELAAVGAASYRVRLLGNATANSGSAIIRAFTPSVSLGSLAAGTRLSFTAWGALIQIAGGASTNLVSLSAEVVWTGAAGTVDLGEVTDPSELSGHVFSVESVEVPSGATAARLNVYATVGWESGATPSDIRLYADAVSVSVP